MRGTFLGATAILLGLTIALPNLAIAQSPISPSDVDFDSAISEPAPAGYVVNTSGPRQAPVGAIRTATTKRTNIVVIMVDDLADMGTRVWDRLPALKDTFITHGIDFTNYFGNDPLCCPGRAGFLTGQYTDHHGVWTNGATLLNPSETLATELQGTGYYTLISGKYFNGTSGLPDKTPPGWSKTSIFGGGYYRYYAYTNGVTNYHGSAPADYSPDVFTNAALQFMRQAPAGKPIFAFLTPYAVHTGEDASGAKPGWNMPVVAPRYKVNTNSTCNGLGPWKPPSYAETDVSDKPVYIQDEANLVASNYPAGWPIGTVCSSLLVVNDELVRVKHELQLEGRLANTMFILTADNGMAFGAHGWPKKDAPYAEDLPLFVSWPAARGTAPAVVRDHLANVDVASTLCEVGGCVMGPYPNGQEVADGQSFLGLIAPSVSASVPQRTALYGEHRLPGPPRPAWRDLRTTAADPAGLWHYVLYDNGEDELYDLNADPGELANLHHQTSLIDFKATLKTRMQAFVTNVKANVP